MQSRSTYKPTCSSTCLGGLALVSVCGCLFGSEFACYWIAGVGSFLGAPVFMAVIIIGTLVMIGVALALFLPTIPQ